MRGGSNPKCAPTASPPPLPAGQARRGRGRRAVPARRGWPGPRGFLEPPVSHPRPPAQPFPVYLPRSPPAALLSTGTPRRARPVPGTLPSPAAGREPVPLPGRSPPLALPAPRHHRIPPEGCCGRAGPTAPPPPSAPGLVPPDPGSEPRHKPAPALPQLPPKAPSHGRLGPRGAFR